MPIHTTSTLVICRTTNPVGFQSQQEKGPEKTSRTACRFNIYVPSISLLIALYRGPHKQFAYVRKHVHLTSSLQYIPVYYIYMKI